MVMFTNDANGDLDDLIKKGELAMKYSNFTTGYDMDDYYRFDRTISGFDTNIYFDTCQSYKQMSHPLWFYIKNQEEYIPVDIETKYMYYNGDVHVSDKGMQDIFRFVDMHKDIIVSLADEIITVSDFMDYLKYNT